MAPSDPAAAESETRDLARRVRERLDGRDLAIAESCTAGAIAVALTTAGDGSTWLPGSLVAYQERVKRSLLGVTASSLVSPAAAKQMVRGIADLLDTDIALATTGVLGDQPVDGVGPSTVLVATLIDGEIDVVRHDLADTHDAGRDEAVIRALQQLVTALDRSATPSRHGEAGTTSTTFR